MKNALLTPYTFVLMNWAAVLGLYRFLRYDENAPSEIWATHIHSHISAAAGEIGNIEAEGIRPAA